MAYNMHIVNTHKTKRVDCIVYVLWHVIRDTVSSEQSPQEHSPQKHVINVNIRGGQVCFISGVAK